MSGAKGRREQLLPGLLPFMAVLLCTMGALVLILILMVSNSQASARRKVEEHQIVVDEKVDDFEFVSRELLAQRQKQQEEISTQRVHLSHYEDHIRRLEEELQSLEKAVAKISRQASNGIEQGTDAKFRIDELQQEIEATKKKAEESKKEKPTKPAFAILPYRGPNGTSRRPIYLECIAEGIRIQPEGTLIPLASLRPPFGPGNPLDASLRYIRTAYEKAGETSSTMAAPYPLLIVRPDGIRTYSLARAAMGGWDDQFGYELVDASMTLAFPPSTPGLADQLSRVVTQATQKHAALVASMPSRYDEGSISNSPIQPEANQEEEWSASDEGDLGIRAVADGDQWEMIQELAPSARVRGGSADPSGRFASRPNPQPSQSTNGQTSASGTSKGTGGQGGAIGLSGIGSPTLSGAPAQGGEWAMVEGSPSDPPSLHGGGSALGASGGSSNWSHDASSGTDFGSGGSSQGAAGGSSGSGGMASGSYASGGGSQGSSMRPILLSSETENTFANDAGANNGAPTNMTLGYQDRPPVEYPSSSKDSAQDSSADASSSRRSSSKNKSKDTREPRALREPSRGWSQSRPLSKATPVIREVYVIVRADRWIVLAEGNSRQVESVISLSQGPSAASTQLTKVLRERVAGWGVAVAGGYWKPKIIAMTYPDSESQTSSQRLEGLLHGSGVDLEVRPYEGSQGK